MLLHIDRMQRVDFLELARASIFSFRESIDTSWDAKLNDQDIFNVVFSMQPDLMKILPCEWNVQLHARINSLIYCHLDMPGRREYRNQPTANKVIPPFFDTNYRRLDDVNLNCPELNRMKIFVCSKQAKVLHFMAGTYNNYNFMLYYSYYWDMYKALSWTLIRK